MVALGTKWVLVLVAVGAGSFTALAMESPRAVATHDSQAPSPTLISAKKHGKQASLRGAAWHIGQRLSAPRADSEPSSAPVQATGVGCCEASASAHDLTDAEPGALLASVRIAPSPAPSRRAPRQRVRANTNGASWRSNDLIDPWQATR